jgi:hypothetical protein
MCAVFPWESQKGGWSIAAEELMAHSNLRSKGYDFVFVALRSHRADRMAMNNLLWTYPQNSEPMELDQAEPVELIDSPVGELQTKLSQHFVVLTE